MKRITIQFFTRILYLLFAVGTIVSLIIVYKDIDSSLAFKFILGYLFFTLFLLLYVPFVTILNSRNLSRVEIRKRLFRFIALIILFTAINYGFDYVFRPSNKDLVRGFSIALGLSFGISFFDIIFSKEKQNKSNI